jgi:hypothetical protein
MPSGVHFGSRQTGNDNKTAKWKKKKKKKTTKKKKKKKKNTTMKKKKSNLINYSYVEKILASLCQLLPPPGYAYDYNN